MFIKVLLQPIYVLTSLLYHTTKQFILFIDNNMSISTISKTNSKNHQNDVNSSSNFLNKKLSSETLLFQRKDLILVTLSSQGLVINNNNNNLSKSNHNSSNSSHESFGEDITTTTQQSNYFTSFFKSCFGNESSTNINSIIPKFISFKNILFIEPINYNDEEINEFKLTYVIPNNDDILKKANKLSIQIINIQIQNLNSINTNGKSIQQYIMNKSYPSKILQQPSILVVINPHGGQGKAIQIYNEKIKPILKAAHCKITFIETKYSKHAIDLAKNLNIEEYDIVLCCSGDGIPHEIINGFYQRPHRGIDAFNKIIITQLPCGSGNAFSLSTLGGSKSTEISTWLMLKSIPKKLDLMCITQNVNNELTTSLSFLSQCFGIIADADCGTEHLRWLGSMRFEIGIVQRLFNNSKYPCDLYVEFVTQDQNEIKKHVKDYTNKEDTNENKELDVEDLTLSNTINDEIPSNWIKLPSSLTNNLNILYVGKMPYVSTDAQFFPAALPNDGNMDMIITSSNTSIIDLSSILLSVEKGTHINMDSSKILHSKIKGYRLIPKLNDENGKHFISIDGESFPFKSFQVEIINGIMTTLLYDGKFTESNLTKDK
ncbi:LCB4 [Candida pseudojiufengensis]|uniref:LCB4 n=1 Tax=Candida pseudojiufengensis TaxID=497109 RepID=UPI002224ADFB|nr:LCB4 [Candida pseudojiufengensis]KAI5963728.1 LCB4 [Candida pseudojiufengensis]